MTSMGKGNSAPGDEKAEFIRRAQAFWADRRGHALTREDARQMVENIAGFFALLDRWSREPERESPDGAAEGPK